MKVITLKSVDSTNIYAKNNLDVLEDGTVIQALAQTAGRGRFSRKWVDLGKGNLFLSFVLKPSREFNPVYSNLTQYLSVVLAKTLEGYGVCAQIKWPNDVLIGNKKIAGILSETVMRGSEFRGLVLGLGVNLNARKADVEAIPDRAVTALNLELNKNVDMSEFIQKLTDKFFADYEEFLWHGFEFIKFDYISRASFLDTEVAVQVLNDVKHGIAKAVNDCGELVLENDGQEFVLTIGDILC